MTADPADADIDIAQLGALVGKEMVSPWREVTQEAIAQFADVTGDRQWIHVDLDRARRESTYGTHDRARFPHAVAHQPPAA